MELEGKGIKTDIIKLKNMLMELEHHKEDRNGRYKKILIDDYR